MNNKQKLCHLKKLINDSRGNLRRGYNESFIRLNRYSRKISIYFFYYIFIIYIKNRLSL